MFDIWAINLEAISISNLLTLMQIFSSPILLGTTRDIRTNKILLKSSASDINSFNIAVHADIYRFSNNIGDKIIGDKRYIFRCQTALIICDIYCCHSRYYWYILLLKSFSDKKYVDILILIYCLNFILSP